MADELADEKSAVSTTAEVPGASKPAGEVFTIKPADGSAVNTAAEAATLVPAADVPVASDTAGEVPAAEGMAVSTSVEGAACDPDG